jgi:long-chain acyl-CoA synthetase
MAPLSLTHRQALACSVPAMVETGTTISEREGRAFDALTLCEAFQRSAADHAKRPALRLASGGVLSWEQYGQRVRSIAAGLAARGVRRGDTVALMLVNRAEAVLIDSAAMHLGAIPFSIYNTSSPEQVEYLLRHAEPRVVLSEERFAPTVLEVASKIEAVELIVLVDGQDASAIGLEELERSGSPSFDFEAAWRRVESDDVATLIYTSGTTGPPKAVELTHSNLLAQLRLLDPVMPLRPAGRFVSYLPMAHLADRVLSHYAALLTGSEVAFVADIAQVIPTVAEVRPTAWGGVPRIWEKLKTGIEAGFAAEPDEGRRTAVKAALEASLAVVRAEQAGREPDPEQLALRRMGEEEVFSVLRGHLGLEETDHLISGAAPIATEVLEFFAALGLGICEIWGMTETSLIATCNPREAIRIGTVGPPLPGLEVSLADDGELLVRGPTIMRGYRGEPDRTAETIDSEGWLHTGDIAEIDPDGYVRIVDRKKELIINSAGKNMSPANIENRIKAASPLVGSAVVIGDRRPYNTALLVLDPVAAMSFAAAHGLSASGPAELALEPPVAEAIMQGIQRANESLSRVEQIKRHLILAEEWQPGGTELTPTMKLKRRPIAQKYAAEIESMYAADRPTA